MHAMPSSGGRTLAEVLIAAGTRTLLPLARSIVSGASNHPADHKSRSEWRALNGQSHTLNTVPTVSQMIAARGCLHATTFSQWPEDALSRLGGGL
jgi:hypothetical protein